MVIVLYFYLTLFTRLVTSGGPHSAIQILRHGCDTNLYIDSTFLVFLCFFLHQKYCGVDIQDIYKFIPFFWLPSCFKVLYYKNGLLLNSLGYIPWVLTCAEETISKLDSMYCLHRRKNLFNLLLLNVMIYNFNNFVQYVSLNLFI